MERARAAFGLAERRVADKAKGSDLQNFGKYRRRM
jgi:hypothetical protein